VVLPVSPTCAYQKAPLSRPLRFSGNGEFVFFQFSTKEREGEYISHHKETAHEETNEDAEDAPISLSVPSLSFCARARAFFGPT